MGHHEGFLGGGPCAVTLALGLFLLRRRSRGYCWGGRLALCSMACDCAAGARRGTDVLGARAPMGGRAAARACTSARSLRCSLSRTCSRAQGTNVRARTGTGKERRTRRQRDGKARWPRPLLRDASMHHRARRSCALAMGEARTATVAWSLSLTPAPGATRGAPANRRSRQRAGEARERRARSRSTRRSTLPTSSRSTPVAATASSSTSAGTR